MGSKNTKNTGCLNRGIEMGGGLRDSFP